MIALVGLLTLNAGATPIVGDISFGGSTTLDNSNLTEATQFKTFPYTYVTAIDGDYSPIPVPLPPSNTTLATFTPFGFRSPHITTPPFQLWTLSYGGETYSFELESLAIEPGGTANSITLSGDGIASGTGTINYADNPGSWVLTANSAGTTFSFSASSSTVPEPGTMLLLGSGLLGLGVYARRRFKI